MASKLTFKQTLLLITGVYLLIRLPWLFMVPMVEAPDEFSHYWVIKFICDHMMLPSPADVTAGGPAAVYGSVPPLGYIPHVIIAKLLPIGDLSMVARFGSLLMGWVAIVASYCFSRELFSDNALCAVAVPLMFLFHPQFVLVNAYSNTDSTATALTTIILFCLVKLLKNGGSSPLSLVSLGLLLGWTALCKYSAFEIYPVTLFAMFAAFYIHRYKAGACVRSLAIVGVTFILTCGWWFWRNYNLYEGDFLGTETMYRNWAITYKRSLTFHMSPWAVIKEHEWWRQVVFSYWGMFGYMTRQLWFPFYITYIFYMAISFGSGLVGLIAGVVKKQHQQLLVERKHLIVPAIWLSLIVSVAINLGLMVAASTVNLGGPQGRYLFPSEAAFMALLIGGLWNLSQRIRRPAVISLLVFNAIVCVYSFAMLYPIYGFKTKIL